MHSAESLEISDVPALLNTHQIRWNATRLCKAKDIGWDRKKNVQEARIDCHCTDESNHGCQKKEREKVIGSKKKNYFQALFDSLNSPAQRPGGSTINSVIRNVLWFPSHPKFHRFQYINSRVPRASINLLWLFDLFFFLSARKTRFTWFPIASSIRLWLASRSIYFMRAQKLRAPTVSMRIFLLLIDE